jgi:hypothetical protein
MLWTAIVLVGTTVDGGTCMEELIRKGLRWESSWVVFTAAWDRERAKAHFERDYPGLKLVALLAGDHADNLQCFEHGEGG